METVGAHAFADLNAEIEIMNHTYLQICKIAVTTKSYSTIESLGLTADDIVFFQSTPLEHLRTLAQQPRSLTCLGFTSNALKNAIAAGTAGPASKPLVQALIICAEKKPNVRSQAF